MDYEKKYKEVLKKIRNYIENLKGVNDGIWSAKDIEKRVLEILPERFKNLIKKYND